MSDLTMLPLHACFAGLLTLLILAAITDLRERRIPNWLNAGVVALYPVYLLLSPIPVAWASALALMLLVGLVGLILFARELIGGGDVKLIAALSLWAGLDHFALFAIVTTLTGGLLGVAVLWSRRWRPLLQAHLAGPGVAMAGGRGAAPAPATSAETPPREPAAGTVASSPATLPYGIAIAAGGAAILVELMKL